ncbi:cation diffusion facilitator family transporter [Nocardioides sp.]|uniref:cation diffusion facilitator family transporter n=1 Tax=Nocardioides sp. TaxID=35761 RepID=UPI003517CFB9
MGHGHGHGHAHGRSRAGDRRRLRIALGITLTVLGVQVVGAVVTGSLALLADAGHLATDAGAVVLALGAGMLAGRPAGPRSTFGWHRAEVLAALANAVVLFGVAAVLVWQAVPRLTDPPEVEAGGLVGFAIVGLLANAAAFAVLSGGDRGSLNLRGALAEVLADLLGSVFAVLAGVVILLTDWQQADPVATLLIAVLIVPRALVLLRDAGAVLLEVAPAGLDLEEVRRHLEELPGVVEVHDLHAWTITSGLASLSAHVTVTEDALAARGVGAVIDDLAECAASHFEVRHTTFQVEPPGHRTHEDLGPLH